MSATNDLTREDFAKLLMEAIRKANPTADVLFDSEKFRLMNGALQVNLANLYNEHCATAPDDRERHLDRIIALLGAPDSRTLPDDYAEARGSLRPKIFSRATFEFMRLEQLLSGEGTEPDLPLYPLGEHLYITLAFDTEHSIRSVSGNELEEWGVSYWQAMEDARDNLGREPMRMIELHEGLIAVVTMDNYDSSRVIFAEQANSIFGLSWRGDAICAVPHRDTMLIADEENIEALSRLLEILEGDLEPSMRPLSTLPVVFRDGQWADWQPELDHPLYAKWHRIRLDFFGRLYTDQKQILDELLDSGEDVPFAASFAAIEKDSKTISYSVWGAGVEAALPETDYVIFASAQGIEAAAPWEVVVAECGEMMERDSRYYPARYRVERFPSAAVLSRMGIQGPFAKQLEKRSMSE